MNSVVGCGLSCFRYPPLSPIFPIMQSVIRFLDELSHNNNREWFAAHKAQYLEARAIFHGFCRQLLTQVAEYTPHTAQLDIKDITYRIHRDIRFSQDKSPYKNHMGVFICPFGKKSGYSGYYFHLQGGVPQEESVLIAVGDYCCQPEVLKTLREDIQYGNGDFHDILTRQINPCFHLDTSSSLKRVPKGFSPDSPWSDYLKLKNFCLCCYPGQSYALQSDLAEQLATLFQSAQPFLEYINRAIDYTHNKC